MGEHIEGASRRGRGQRQDGNGIVGLQAVGGCGRHDGPVILAFQESGQYGDAGGGYQGSGLWIDIPVMP